MELGSKKKKGSSSNRGSRSIAARETKKDMSKYAGATSNKSKRNYAELRLARPDNLKEYASENAPVRNGGETFAPRSEAASPSAGVSKRTGSTAVAGQPASPTPKKNTHSKKKTAPKSGATKKRGAGAPPTFAASAQGLAAKQSSPKKKKRNSVPPPAPKTTPTVNSPTPDYEQDEYSKALFGSDFYSSVYNLYDMKHPEKSDSSRTTPMQSRGKTKKKASGRGKSVGRISGEKGAGKSVAAYAVKNRGTAVKKPHAQIMKTGKARGVVTSKVAHRKVHRRNRKTSMLFNAVAVMMVIVFLAAVYITVFFHVKNIVVKGESPYTPDKISDICVFEKGDNILFIDATTSEKAIVAQLPYIEKCAIKRRLPATVEVNVTPAHVVGVADTGYQQWVIVSGSGKVLETVTNLMQVSDSDLVSTLSYVPDYKTVKDVAAARHIPVLEGLSIRTHTADGYLQGEDAAHVGGFARIVEQAKAVGLHLSVLRYGNRGYEAEYDGRINIVVGDFTDVSVVKRRLEIANYIVNVSGDVTEHDRGEITFLKNEAFFNPSYEMADDVPDKKESTPEKEQTDSEKPSSERKTWDSQLLLEAAEKLLRQGAAVLPEGDKSSAVSASDN